VGSEGTLGVITAATLKLFPEPRSVATAWVAVAGVQQALTLLNLLRESSGDRVSSFELIPNVALALVREHIAGAKDPQVEPSDWYVLCEIASSAEENMDALLEAALGDSMDRKLVQDAAIAQSDAQRANFWKLRESVPESQRHVGASIKHDISVPASAMPEFVERGTALVASIAPEGMLVAYGHLGDGNLHFNLSKRPKFSDTAFMARREPLQRAVHDLVAQLGGSISAEHGIGRYKVGELERYAAPLELELMRGIKHTLDPNGIMNPGKVLRKV
ncbi:MAG: FAD-binding oxidoreductase, partial [Steroidobacteraceae bacterium]